MKKFILIISMVLVFAGVRAQTTFQRVYPNIRGFQSVQQTADSGYILAGYNITTAYLLKLDAQANVMWSKTFGGANDKYFYSVRQTTDGGYIAAGEVKVGTNNYDIYLARTNASGDTLWTKRYGGSSSEEGRSVSQTSDGGFIVAGHSYSYGGGRAYLMKTDANGNIVWTKTYKARQANSVQNFSNVQITNDGGYILSGTSGSVALVIKTDSVGDTLWTRGFGFNNYSNHIKCNSIIQTSDGGYMMLESADNMTNISAAAMIKLTSSGDTSWTKIFTFMFSSSSFTNLSSIIQTPGGGYLFGGTADQSTFGPSTITKGIMIKTDLNGNIIWTKKYDSEYEFNYTLINAADITNFGSLLVGSKNNNAYLIKTDSSGNSSCGNDTVTFYHTTYPIKITVIKGDTVGSGGTSNQISSVIGTLNTFYSNACLPLPDICMVTVDPATNKNMVIWEKNNIDTNIVKSFNIYKESTSAGVYTLIGNVPHNSLSTFIDVTSNPSQIAARYKITTVDAQGAESYTTSQVHKTIHLSINLGVPPQINLNWDAYEGFTVPTYRIWRGNSGGMTLIDSVQGTLFSYSDLNPPANDTIYFIEAQHTPCNPTAKSYSSTKSNYASLHNAIGISEIRTNQFISISPNPATTSLTINGLSTSATADIFDVSGKLLLTKQLNTNQIDISSLAPGLYFIKLSTEEGSVVRKFVKE